ncbi:MAG: hypothetical protein DRQ55_07405 [Planctomycetota bacterium]|nr:MAG: hypothetical protein DRQ55_07405 [Planctomycetota bacterium]
MTSADVAADVPPERPVHTGDAPVDGSASTPAAAGCTEPAAEAAPAPRSRRNLILLLVVLALVAAVKLLPVQAWLDGAIGWVDGLGAWGPLATVFIYVLATVLFAPASVLTLGAGAVFGVGLGAVTVFVGATLGACAAFLVGRHLARDKVAARIAGNVKFAAIDRAVGQQGFRIVLLTRLSPVFPFNLLNYAYGLTGVSFRDYALASVGMAPGTIMYVYAGAAAAEAAGGAGDGVETGQQVLFWAGLAFAVVVCVLVTRIAKRALAEAVQPDAAQPDAVQPEGDRANAGA